MSKKVVVIGTTFKGKLAAELAVKIFNKAQVETTSVSDNEKSQEKCDHLHTTEGFHGEIWCMKCGEVLKI